MRFDLKKPCPECPFTRAAGGFLSEARARDIAETILHGDLTFTCHKHINGSYPVDPETGEEDPAAGYCPGGQDQHCAGALAFYDKLEAARADGDRTQRHVANAMLQIAERLGLRDRSRLAPASLAQVYDSVEEMAAAHRTTAPRRPS